MRLGRHSPKLLRRFSKRGPRDGHFRGGAHSQRGATAHRGGAAGRHLLTEQGGPQAYSKPAARLSRAAGVSKRNVGLLLAVAVLLALTLPLTLAVALAGALPLLESLPAALAVALPLAVATATLAIAVAWATWRAGVRVRAAPLARIRAITPVAIRRRVLAFAASGGLSSERQGSESQHKAGDDEHVLLHFDFLLMVESIGAPAATC